MKFLQPFIVFITLFFACCINEVEKESAHSIRKDSTSHKEVTVNKDNGDNADSLVDCSRLEIIPINNIFLDSSILTFNLKLQTAVDNKDISALLKLADKKIITSHGGAIVGIKDFMIQWHLNTDPKNSELWNKLNTALKLGGCFDTEEKDLYFVFPYLQSTHYFKKCSFDWYATCICIQPKVYLYNKPDINAKILDTLSYRILNCGYDHKIIDKFIAVKTIDSTLSGYVLSDQIYFPQDYLISIEKKSGEWKITSFAPYD